MKRFILIIIFFVIFTNTTEAQIDNIKLDCIENNQICDYLLENGNTIWKNCVTPYFPPLPQACSLWFFILNLYFPTKKIKLLAN